MSEMDLEYELEIEAELERERHEPMPPEDTDQDNVEPEGVSQVVQASITPYLPHDPIKGLMQRMRAWNAIEIENRTNSNFMPPIGSIATDGRTGFTPKPKTPTSSGNVLACVAEMGRGKSTMIRNFQRSTITIRPQE